MYSRIKLFSILALIASSLFFSGCAGNTVAIGQQVWMSNNANTAMEGTRCYKVSGDGKSCVENYMVYTWESAVRACPQGFHLPNKEEFALLEKTRLSKKDANLWCLGKEKTLSGGLCYETAFSAFWTRSEKDKRNAVVWDVDFNYKYFEPRVDNKNEYYAVRCIQD